VRFSYEVVMTDTVAILLDTLRLIDAKKAETCGDSGTGWYHLEHARLKLHNELKRFLTNHIDACTPGFHRHVCDCGDYRICTKTHASPVAPWVCPSCEDDQRHAELERQMPATPTLAPPVADQEYRLRGGFGIRRRMHNGVWQWAAPKGSVWHDAGLADTSWAVWEAGELEPITAAPRCTCAYCETYVNQRTYNLSGL